MVQTSTLVGLTELPDVRHGEVREALFWTELEGDGLPASCQIGGGIGAARRLAEAWTRHWHALDELRDDDMACSKVGDAVVDLTTPAVPKGSWEQVGRD